MVRKKDEAMLGANFPTHFVESFWEKAMPATVNRNKVIEAMAKLWLDLPEEARRNILYPVQSDTPLVDIIKEIVRSEVKVAIAATESVAAHKGHGVQKKKNAHDKTA